METIKNYRILSLVLAAIILLLWLPQTCDDKSTIDIVTPEIKGEIIDDKPVVHIPSKPGKTVVKWEDRFVPVPAAVDSVAFAAYIRETDSIKRAQQFAEAVTINNFSKSFEDDRIKLTVSGESRGTILSMSISQYTIKPMKVKAEVKQTVFRLLAGGDLGLVDRAEFSYNGRVSGQFKSGDQISVGYGRIGEQEFATVGYQFSVFDIKR